MLNLLIIYKLFTKGEIIRGKISNSIYLRLVFKAELHFNHTMYYYYCY